MREQPGATLGPSPCPPMEALQQMRICTASAPSVCAVHWLQKQTATSYLADNSDRCTRCLMRAAWAAAALIVYYCMKACRTPLSGADSSSHSGVRAPGRPVSIPTTCSSGTAEQFSKSRASHVRPCAAATAAETCCDIKSSVTGCQLCGARSSSSVHASAQPAPENCSCLQN